jgi:hypothetical protein
METCLRPCGLVRGWERGGRALAASLEFRTRD